MMTPDEYQQYIQTLMQAGGGPGPSRLDQVRHVLNPQGPAPSDAPAQQPQGPGVTQAPPQQSYSPGQTDAPPQNDPQERATAAYARARLGGAAPLEAKYQRALVSGGGLPGPRSPYMGDNPANLGADPSTSPGRFRQSSRVEVLRQANQVASDASSKQGLIAQLLKSADPRGSSSPVALAAQSYQSVIPQIEEEEEKKLFTPRGLVTRNTMSPTVGAFGGRYTGYRPGSYQIQGV